MKTHLQFTITYPDVRAAMPLIRPEKFFSGPMVGLIVLLLMAVFTYLFVDQRPAANSSPQDGLRNAIIALAPYLLIFVSGLLLVIFAGRWKQRKAHEKAWHAKDKKVLNDVTFSRRELTWQANGKSITTDWSEYIRFAENTKVFVLFTAPRVGTIVPKRIMSAEQISQLREILSQNITPKRVVPARGL
jgi:hypothetical protein